MIAEELVDTFATCTGCSSGRLGEFLLQLAEDGFRFVYTSTTSRHEVLLPPLGNAFLHFIVCCHDFSTLAASAMRHLAFCFAEMQCMSLGTQGARILERSLPVYSFFL